MNYAQAEKEYFAQRRKSPAMSRPESIRHNTHKEKIMRNTATHLLLSGLMLASLGTLANAQLTTTRIDLNPASTNFDDNGTIAPNEYGTGNAYQFTGGGTGFGGTVGNSTLYMDFSASDLKLAMEFDGNLDSNIAVIYFDTKAGGFGDADMDDQGDGGRRVVSNLTRDVNDVFPFQADYALAMGSFGSVMFELNAGNTPNHLGFVAFDNDTTLTRELSYTKAQLGIGESFDFFVTYCSDTNFMSNETIPNQNIANNPGFDNNGTNTPVQLTRFNRFQAVPSPAAWSVFALGGLPVLSALRRRRK
jgi:hypothetical protein